VARFLQHTSRDLDPQLHVHQAVLNKAEGADGTWRALDGKALHTVRPAAAAISERVMETQLSAALGVQWELREDGVGRRVVGIDPQLEELFSGRRQTITAETAQRIAAYEETIGRTANNLERSRIAQAATLATRRAKTHDSESQVEQHERWNAEASALVAGGLTRQAAVFARSWGAVAEGQAPGAAPVIAPAATAEQFSPAAVIAQALEACHGPDGKSAYTRHDLVRQIDLALPASPTRPWPTAAWFRSPATPSVSTSCCAPLTAPRSPWTPPASPTPIGATSRPNLRCSAQPACVAGPPWTRPL
jgi:hypothetical protein